MAELILRLREARSAPGPRGDLVWVAVAGGVGALVLASALMVSLQAACAFVVVLVIIALYQHDRRWGIAALFALWFTGPLIRRLLQLMTGFVDNDPLSLAPFLATAAVAAIELLRVHVPTHIRRILLLAAGGFAIGFPVGLATGPSSAIYAFIAYLAAVSGAALGIAERSTLRESNVRRVLLFGLPPVAAYAIWQHYQPVPIWDRQWLEATKFVTVGAGKDPGYEDIRAFASLNSPGTLAGLLGLSLLCYLSMRRARPIVLAGAVLILVGLSVTFVRSSWVALIAAGVAHVVVSGGRSARLVFGSAAVIAAAAIALSPVSTTARDVVNRFESIGGYQTETSTKERSATFGQTLPVALGSPLGHGLGSAGEASKLEGESDLRAPDNGYLALMYQVGPLGFLLVMAAICFIMPAAWEVARARGPGQEVQVLFFAILVYCLVALTAGDAFYGAVGVIFWFVSGQTLAYQWRLRAATEAARRERDAARERLREPAAA